MYSFEAPKRLPPNNPAYTLGQVLGRQAEDPSALVSPWRKFFEPYKPQGNDALVSFPILVHPNFRDETRLT